MKIKYKKIPTNLTEFENLEGLLEVKINSELEKEADLIIETAKNKELILNKLDKNSISSSDYNLKRVNMTRKTLSKKDVPLDIWNKYSKETYVTSYYLHPLKRK